MRRYPAAQEGRPGRCKSNVLGLYRSHISKDVVPDDVQISCEKSGYKQIRVYRRTPPGNTEMFIETECTMQRPVSGTGQFLSRSSQGRCILLLRWILKVVVALCGLTVLDPSIAKAQPPDTILVNGKSSVLTAACAGARSARSAGSRDRRHR